MIRTLLRALLITPVLAAATLWASAALWFDGPASRPLAAVLAAAWVLAALGLLWRLRSFRRGLAGFSLLFLAVLLWWLSIEPSAERDWDPTVARVSEAVIEGDRVTLTNVRNFDYRTEEDFVERWEDRSYDLSRLQGVDLFLSYWGSPWIAHTIVSWEFDDGQHLAVSIETRKEKHESYSAVRGFFRQYELHYVVADERDVIRVRTNHRGEDTYLYRLSTPRDTARALLIDYLEEINRLAHHPRWYNALTHNCTTTIRRHAQHVAPGNPWDWRILVNGRIDELGYSRGTVNTDLPFSELRQRSAISKRATRIGQDYFSRRIRAGLPARPGRP